jgi:hypothetical protein
MNTLSPQIRGLILIVLLVVVIAAVSWFFTSHDIGTSDFDSQTGISTTTEADADTYDPIWDPLPMPRLVAEGDESIPDYWKRYKIGDMEYEAFAVFARIQNDDGTTGILFDGFFASEKYVGELSGISCDITRAPATETKTGYSVETNHGMLIFIEDESGLRIDVPASTGLGFGCFKEVTWADMPVFTAEDRSSIWPGEYYGILNRG